MNWYMKDNNYSVGWSCPSNIAIVKYWGKRSVQLPMNPSLSLTLKQSLTITSITCEHDPSLRKNETSFLFEGKEHPAFNQRIQDYIRKLEPFLTFLPHTRLHIESKNTFPHSSGIASSASALGALALCLTTLSEQITGTPYSNLLKKASCLARLGSGSASRSVYPEFALWGQSDTWYGSSDQYAIPVSDTHSNFKGMRDSILIVDPGEKKVSSRLGHSLMETNTYASTRFQQAHSNIAALKKVLKEGDWSLFIEMMEEEALTLHAMMLTGKPGYILMKPGTLEIIRKVQDYRNSTGHHLGFTLDAGANVHLLYDRNNEMPVREFIESRLLKHCQNKQVIHDEMGNGPVNLHL